MTLEVEYLPHGRDLPLPRYQSEGASGIDLYAAIDTECYIEPQAYMAIPTGLKIILPPQCEAQIRPRSGLALRFGVTVLNTPGTIDNDYRGEIMIILINHGKERFCISPAMRIAQLVVTQIVYVDIQQKTVDTKSTKRGEKGFGSTGLS